MESDLSRANLRCADLRGASFYCASLLKADLSDAIMDKDTVFVRADLTDAVEGEQAFGLFLHAFPGIQYHDPCFCL